MKNYTWMVRAHRATQGATTVYARNHTFTIGPSASFKETDPHPSAVESLLGALAGDLIDGFQTQAKRQRLTVDALEITVSGQLNNPLMYLGVIGETGHPGFESISATLYVSADTDESTLQALWETTRQRSPLVNTLKRGVKLSLDIKLVY